MNSQGGTLIPNKFTLQGVRDNGERDEAIEMKREFVCIEAGEE